VHRLCAREAVRVRIDRHQWRSLFNEHHRQLAEESTAMSVAEHFRHADERINRAGIRWQVVQMLLRP
jgi:hypothetical protein